MVIYASGINHLRVALMPYNLTPLSFRRLYNIFPKKKCVINESPRRDTICSMQEICNVNEF